MIAEEQLLEEQAADVLSTQHLRADLKGRSVRGGLITIASQGTQFIVQSVATVVLARLLSPGDFGLVAMITSVTALASAFADLGLSEATIQCETIDHEQISALFWTNVAIGLGLMLLTMAMAPVFAWFYKEPPLQNIALVISATFLISGLRVQHDALLKRQMRFLAIAIRDVTAYLVAVPIAIVMALKGAGYWALVALPLVLNTIIMALSWLIVRWKPGLPRRGARVRSLISFGGNVAASYLLLNINRNADNVLIGRVVGAAPLGFYSRAYNLLMLPIKQLSVPASSVAVPAFSRIQDDTYRFANYYTRALNLILWISAPIFGFLFVAAKPIIVLVLGKQWEAAAPVFQLLAIGALGQLLFDSTIWLFISRGKSAQLLKLFVVISPLLIGGYALGLPFGIKGVALSGSIVLLAMYPWMLKFTFSGTALTLRGIGRAMVCPISVSVSALAIALIVLKVSAPHSLISQLLVTAMAFVLVYSISLTVSPVRTEVSGIGGLLKDLKFAAE